MKHGIGQISGSFSRGVESLKKSAHSRGGSTSVYCKGVRQLDDYGYEKFNLEDGGEEIFISRHSEKSMFNEDDSILIRATDGNFVTQPDTTKEVPTFEEPAIETSDARRLFGNVPVSNAPCEFQAVVGTVDDGKVVPTPVDTGFLSRMVKPSPGMQKLDMDTPAYKEVTLQGAPEVPAEAAPVSNSFLDRMVKVIPAEEEPEIIEETNEVAEIALVEIPEAVEEPAEEIPEIAETPIVESVENEEFFIGTEEESVEASSEEFDESLNCDNNSLDDDYSMMFPDYEDAEVADISGEVPEAVDGTPSSGCVEEPAEEVVEAPVEECEIPEVVEAPVEEPIVAEPRIEQTIEVPEMPEGLYVEGNEPGNVAVASAGDAVQTTEATVTGSTVAEPPSNIRVGLDADGEALPPISDPVVTRPRSVRFRFANGVLMSVDSKTEGSQEGPARPLE